MKNKIYVKDWQVLKPENFSSNTDLYYLKVSNQIYSKITPETEFLLSQFIDKEEIKLLCCFATCYFEDIISQTNVWLTFKFQHKKLYNKPLPFYAVTNNYIEDEINTEDLTFLAWYFLNSIQQEKFLNPQHYIFSEFAKSAMSILEEEYEFAPENTKLKTYFSFNAKKVDFYNTREFIQNVFFNSYLFFTDVKIRLDNEVFDIMQKNIDVEDPEVVMSYVREVTENFTFNKRSALLALTAKDWASNIIEKKHSEFKKINSITPKIIGLFLYKSQNNDFVILEHIASGMLFNMTKKSFDYSETLNEDQIIYIGLVQWNKEWWFSGSFALNDFDADIILDLKNSSSARSDVNFLNDKNEVDKIIKLQENAFLKFNKNKSIAFLKPKEVDVFISDFMNFYNKSLNLSEEDTQDAYQRTRNDGYFGNENELNKFNHEIEECIIYFNPKSGIEIYFDVINAFPDKNNPFFKEEKSDDIMHLLINEEYSTEFVNYFIYNYKNKLSFFSDEINKLYLEDIDFLLRFWKKDAYVTKQALILTGSNPN